MKRLHIHIKTEDLEKSVAFYTAMLAAPPTKKEQDYAKWLLDDPVAHISLSTHNKGNREGSGGIDHVGISLDTEADLDATAKRVRDAGTHLTPEKQTTCCYAKSNKYWAHDPNGAVWELFQTYDQNDLYGEEPTLRAKQ